MKFVRARRTNVKSKLDVVEFKRTAPNPYKLPLGKKGRKLKEEEWEDTSEKEEDSSEDESMQKHWEKEAEEMRKQLRKAEDEAEKLKEQLRKTKEEMGYWRREAITIDGYLHYALLQNRRIKDVNSLKAVWEEGNGENQGDDDRSVSSSESNGRSPLPKNEVIILE